MIVVITGIQAAGKSTVAQALAERIPDSVHVRGDLFRRMVVNGRAEMGAQEPSAEALRQLRLRHDLTVDVADGYAAAGFTVVVQDIILGESLADVVDRVRTRPLSVVVLCPSPVAVQERDHERQRLSGKVAYRQGEHDVAGLDSILREATPRIGLWLDTSDQTVEETVDTILSSLDSEARVGG